MKKSSLRSLGVGFLSAAILTGAYAAFFQGHVPVDGVTIDSVFQSENIESYEQQVSEDQEIINNLSDNQAQIEAELENASSENASLNERLESQKESIDYLASMNESLQDILDEYGIAGIEEETTTDTEEEEETEETSAAASGEFSIEDGQSSAEIANNLEAQGYIESAAEFQELLDQWNLSSVIQSGTYDIDEGMTIHEIASVITNGAYFFQ